MYAFYPFAWNLSTSLHVPEASTWGPKGRKAASFHNVKKPILTKLIHFLQALLEENPAKHPIIILKDVPFQHLTAILEFMYAGEVNVAQDQLPAFLKTAERLKVKGLAEAPQTIKQEWT